MKYCLASLLLTFIFCTSCHDEPVPPRTHSISGFVKTDDERGFPYQTKDESGFLIELFRENTPLKKYVTPSSGTFSFTELDSTAYQMVVSKQGYADLYYMDRNLLDNSISVTVPSIPTFKINKIFAGESQFQNHVRFEIDVQNFLVGRYAKKYMRFFLHHQPDVSSTNYTYTDRLGIPLSSTDVLPLNTSDAKLDISLPERPGFNNFSSGQKVFFAFYPTSEYDPNFLDERSGMRTYTGLSDQAFIGSFVMP